MLLALLLQRVHTCHEDHGGPSFGDARPHHQARPQAPEGGQAEGEEVNRATKILPVGPLVIPKARGRTTRRQHRGRPAQRRGGPWQRQHWPAIARWVRLCAPRWGAVAVNPRGDQRNLTVSYQFPCAIRDFCRLKLLSGTRVSCTRTDFMIKSRSCCTANPAADLCEGYDSAACRMIVHKMIWGQLFPMRDAQPPCRAR